MISNVIRKQIRCGSQLAGARARLPLKDANVCQMLSNGVDGESAEQMLGRRKGRHHDDSASGSKAIENGERQITSAAGPIGIVYQPG
ncbi:MAG TPA: hypothetical protein VE871_09865 [Longimicrobium sp.]|nr:hypothetical protein [Longimicrobium sp.]